jgi:hypothetical protein
MEERRSMPSRRLNDVPIVGVPRYVLMSWHIAALVTAAMLVMLAVFSFQGLQTTKETVVQMRVLNRFLDSTLVVAQFRADSLRAVRFRRVDSLARVRNP